MNNISSLSRLFAEQTPLYPPEVRQAWAEVLISCWQEGNDDYINELRSEPLTKLQGNPIIDESLGKYFPLPDAPPKELIPNSPEKEKALRDTLAENFRHFGQMMIAGGWTENDGEVWIDIIVRAWKEPDFLKRLRNNPKETLERDFPDLNISASLGKFFPISKEKPEDLKGLTEEELRRKLGSDETNYMGWMMTCCR